MSILTIGKHLAIKQMNSGQEKQFSVMDRMDLTNSSTLQWQAKPDQDHIATNARRKKEAKASKFRGLLPQEWQGSTCCVPHKA